MVPRQSRVPLSSARWPNWLRLPSPGPSRPDSPSVPTSGHSTIHVASSCGTCFTSAGSGSRHGTSSTTRTITRPSTTTTALPTSTSNHRDPRKAGKSSHEAQISHLRYRARTPRVLPRRGQGYGLHLLRSLSVPGVQPR